MATKIQIKRTNTGNIPQTVNAGELVYVAHSAGTNANSPNKDKLFIGSVDAQDYIPVGGKRFTDMLDVVAGTVSASKALVVDGSSKLDVLNIDDLQFDGKIISTVSGNNDINVTPHGTGSTVIKNPKVEIDGTTHLLKEFIQDNSGGQLTEDSEGTVTITYDDQQGITTIGIGAGKVGTTQLKNEAVTADKLGPAAVETGKIKDSAVTAGKILDGTITSGKIGLDQVDNTHLAINSVDEEQLKTNAVTADKIKNGEVTKDKIGADAIDDTKIANDAVKAEHLDQNAVESEAIKNQAVTSAKIANGAVEGTNIANNAVNSAQIAAGAIRGYDSVNNAGREIAGSTVTVNELADDAVETLKIKDGAVTAAKFASGALITSAMIVNGTIQAEDLKNEAVTADKILNGAVTTDKILNDAVTSGKILNGAVTPGKLADNAVVATNIANGAVTHDKLAAGTTPAVENDNIKDSTIAGTKIASNTITASNIAGSTITAAEIAAGTITNSEIANSTIENAKLANSSIKIGSSTISLGTTGETDIAGLTSLAVDSISVNGNTIATNLDSVALVLETLNNKNISLAPNGDGTVAVPSNYNTRNGFGDDSLTNKKYVDAVAAGLSIKDAVKVASIQNFAADYVNGTNGVGATLTASASGALTGIDGQAVSVGDRILVKDQTLKVQNGIYTVTSLGGTSSNFQFTRAVDADESTQLSGGSFVFVELGTANSDAGFVSTHDGNPTMGTTEITFTQFSGAGSIIAGDAMGKSGNTLNVKFDGVTIEQNADALRVKDGAIDNDKVKAATISGSFGSSGYTTSGILQSKLAMNAAVATKSSATGITESDLGIAHFDANQFSVISGFATVNALDGGSY